MRKHFTARHKFTGNRLSFFYDTLEEAQKRNPNFRDWRTVEVERKDGKVKRQ